MSHALSNKDRKQLGLQLAKLDYDEKLVSHLLGGDDELFIDKIAGSKCVIYQKNGQPLMFCPDHKA